MMTHKKTIILKALVGLTAVLLVAIYAWAEPPREPFTATELHGYGSPERMWTKGNVLHIRNQHNTNSIICGDKRVAGINNVIVNVDVNLATGKGNWHAKTVLVPDEVDGTWEMTGHGKFLWGVGASGEVVGYGTGELQGLEIFMSWEINGPITGYILDPHGE